MAVVVSPKVEAHVVVLCDHLDQLITGDEGQNHACNGKHYVPGQRLDHSENARFKIGWFGADLLCDVAHLGVDVIKQAGKIGHDRRCQQRLDPIRDRFENCFHSAPPPIKKNG